jgi:hypothetical protein
MYLTWLWSTSPREFNCFSVLIDLKRRAEKRVADIRKFASGSLKFWALRAANGGFWWWVKELLEQELCLIMLSKPILDLRQWILLLDVLRQRAIKGRLRETECCKEKKKKWKWGEKETERVLFVSIGENPEKKSYWRVGLVGAECRLWKGT